MISRTTNRSPVISNTRGEIVDVYGKVVVETGRAPSLQARIDVSGLAAGMYFVRVMTKEGTVTRAFVKK